MSILRYILPGFSGEVRLIAFTRAILALGFALSIPFLSLYLHEDLGIPMTQVGIMLTCAGLIGSGAATLGGALSDRFGRKGLLVFFMLCRMLTFVVLSFLVWHRTSFVSFAMIYIVSAPLGTAMMPIMDAIIADVTGINKRAEAYGILRIAANMGWALGPALGGFLVSGGYHLLFLVTAVSLAFSASLITWRLRETHFISKIETRNLDLGIVIRDRVLFRFLMICLIMYIVKGQLIATLSVYASGNVGLTKAQIGLLYFENGAMVAVFQLFITRMVKRFKPLKILISAALLYGAGFFLVGRSHSALTLAFCVAMITTAEMMEAPTTTTFISRLAPEGRTGVYMGSFSLVMHLGWTIGPLVGGLLLDNFVDPVNVWNTIGMFALLASVGFFILQQKKTR